jgi:hypothetical protein
VSRTARTGGTPPGASTTKRITCGPTPPVAASRTAPRRVSSIYRTDDQVLVNAHVYGNTAACAPVLHLRKVSGGSLVTVYTECIERVWEQAKPWNGEDS